MRKAVKQILLCAAALLLVCLACRAAFFDHLNIYIPLQGATEPEAEIRVEQPDILRAGEAESRGGYLRLPLYPAGRGETDLVYGNETDGALKHELRVDRFHTVYDMNTGNFTGDTAVMIAVTLFWGLVSAIMLWHFFQAKGSAFYDYATIYYAGFSLFTLESAVVQVEGKTSNMRSDRAGAITSMSAREI